MVRCPSTFKYISPTLDPLLICDLAISGSCMTCWLVYMYIWLVYLVLLHLCNLRLSKQRTRFNARDIQFPPDSTGQCPRKHPGNHIGRNAASTALVNTLEITLKEIPLQSRLWKPVIPKKTCEAQKMRKPGKLHPN